MKTLVVTLTLCAAGLLPNLAQAAPIVFTAPPAYPSHQFFILDKLKAADESE